MVSSEVITLRGVRLGPNESLIVICLVRIMLAYDKVGIADKTTLIVHVLLSKNIFTNQNFKKATWHNCIHLGYDIY